MIFCVIALYTLFAVMIVVGRSMALENVIAFCNPSFLVTHSAARESFTKYVTNSHPFFQFSVYLLLSKCLLKMASIDIVQVF